MTETYRNQDRCEFATRFFGTPPFEVSGGLSLVSDNALVAHLHKLRRTNQFGLINHCAFMYILLRFYSPTWFPLSNPFPPATSPYLQFDLFDVQSSIYPIRLVLWQEGTRLRDLPGAVPHLSGNEVLFAARPTSPLQRERHSPEFILSSF